uniref:Uncharacterized protein n=1 Tax=Arundo donax TaxID=35708 RepID=A0A0A9GFC4_ARUDO
MVELKVLPLDPKPFVMHMDNTERRRSYYCHAWTNQCNAKEHRMKKCFILFCMSSDCELEREGRRRGVCE